MIAELKNRCNCDRCRLQDLVEVLAKELANKNRQLRGLLEFIRWLDPFGNARRAKERGTP